MVESQVVFEPNSNGAPSVKIMTSPDEEANGKIPNGHQNGHLQVPNGHGGLSVPNGGGLQVPNGHAGLQVPNGHANGHIPNDPNHLSPNRLSPHGSPQRDVFPDHGIGMVPRSPQLNRRSPNHSPTKEVYPDHGIGIVPRSPRLNRRSPNHSAQKEVYPDHGIGIVPRSPRLNRRSPHHHEHSPEHEVYPDHGISMMSSSPRLHRKKHYIPLEANDDEDEPGEMRLEGRIPTTEKMVEDAVMEEDEGPEPPKDRCYLVYMIMALHGVGMLLPWNMFITAEAYFTQHKFANVSDETEYKDKFVSYLGIIGFVPNAIFLFVCLFFPPKASRFMTLVALNIMLSLFVMTTILAVVDSAGWPKLFFGITMATIVIFNCGSAIYQSGLYAMCARFPEKYMQSYIIGQGLGGSLCAVIGIVTLAEEYIWMQILTLKFNVALFVMEFQEVVYGSEGSFRTVGDLKVAAILYFACAVVVLFLCVVTLYALVKMPFVKFYLDQVIEHSLEEKEQEALEDERPPLLQIFKDIWLQIYNIWLTFFVSLTIFPSIMVMVRPTGNISPFMNQFFTPLTCFLLFNFCDFIGSCIPAWVKWPSAKYTWILTSIRVLFYPIFLFANYRPETRTLPVFLNNWAYVICVIAMSVSNGYLKTIVMMDGPQAVRNPNWAGKAASMMVLFLVLGIFCGIQFSLAFPPLSELGSSGAADIVLATANSSVISYS